jgi:hypothetical protein
MLIDVTILTGGLHHVPITYNYPTKKAVSVPQIMRALSYMFFPRSWRLWPRFPCLALHLSSRGLIFIVQL